MLVCRHTRSGSVHHMWVCGREKTQDLGPPRRYLPIALTDVYGVTLRSMGRFALFFHEEGACLMEPITATVTARAGGRCRSLRDPGTGDAGVHGAKVPQTTIHPVTDHGVEV